MALRQASAERSGSRGATAGTDRAGCGPIVNVPRSFLSTLKAGFFSWPQTGLETALLAGRSHRGMECRQRLWISTSGSSSGCRHHTRPRGLAPAPRADPVGRLVTGQHIADVGDAAVLTTPDGEPLHAEPAHDPASHAFGEGCEVRGRDRPCRENLCGVALPPPCSRGNERIKLREAHQLKLTTKTQIAQREGMHKRRWTVRFT